MNCYKLMGVACCFCLMNLAGVQAQEKSENNSKCKQKMERTGSDAFVFGNDAPWEELGGGVKRQILGYDGQLMMVKVVFEKGAIGAHHHHYQSQSTYVAKGKFEFTIDGVTKVVSEGDCLFKTPDKPHGCVCLEAGVLIDTFSPVRADFLKK